MNESAKPGTPPPLPVSMPAANELEQALLSLKGGPWNPHVLIQALIRSDAYLLLETPADPEMYLLLISDKVPHVAFFSSPSKFAAAQREHPGFVHPHKVRLWDFILSLNDGVGFIINPYSPESEYYAGPDHTAAIRGLVG